MHRTLDGGPYGAIAEEERLVVENESQWRALWARLHAERAPALPRVDFERERVLAVTMGERPNGCYAIRIARTHVEDLVLNAQVASYVPEPREACTEALTRPYHVVAVEREGWQEARFEEWETTEQPPPGSLPDPPVVYELPPEGRSGAYNATGFRSLERGGHSRSTEPARLVFTQPDEWDAFYKGHDAPSWRASEENGWERVQQPTPAVNFSDERAVAVLMGEKPSGCYGIRVESVRLEGETTRVEVVRNVPGPGAGCTAVMTQPYHLIALPADGTTIEFVERTNQL